MAQDESKNLKKYFENDPPSFFDELAVKEGKKFKEDPIKVEEGEIKNLFLDESLKILAEVRDLWPYPSKGDKYTPTVPFVTTESLVIPSENIDHNMSSEFILERSDHSSSFHSFPV